MAGGELAAVVPCMTCGARAVRTGEGSEDDWYRCEAGHVFGIDWSHEGPPTEPQWPPRPGFRSLEDLQRSMRKS